MRIIITGSKGLLGKQLVSDFKTIGFEVCELDVPEYNIISHSSIKKAFIGHDTQFLINCAAYTEVEKAETEQKKAYFVNVAGCGIVAKLCLDHDIHMIHISSDFVFDGEKGTAYTEGDKHNPLNYYGRTKSDSENVVSRKLKKHTIFRLQWLYGNSPKTFFSRILEKANEQSLIPCRYNEIGSPCSVDFVSRIIAKYVTEHSSSYGTYHLTHNNSCSRFECASYFLKKLDWKGNLSYAESTMTDFPRPEKGILDNSKLSNLLQADLGTWEEDLDNFLDKYNICLKK